MADSGSNCSKATRPAALLLLSACMCACAIGRQVSVRDAEMPDGRPAYEVQMWHACYDARWPAVLLDVLVFPEPLFELIGGEGSCSGMRCVTPWWPLGWILLWVPGIQGGKLAGCAEEVETELVPK